MVAVWVWVAVMVAVVVMVSVVVGVVVMVAGGIAVGVAVEAGMNLASSHIQKAIDTAAERAIAEIRILADAARRQIVCQYKFSNRSAGQRRRWAKVLDKEV